MRQIFLDTETTGLDPALGPTGAWDMQKFFMQTAKAGPACRPPKDKSQTQPLRRAA